ncbi:MAG: acetate kinase [Candidatus Omnitrophica bacterium CG11_big_fil_rev_8_21_14_0_20_42_13]|uniref:Acetate kinase n=1 Tax=Candidatus Ghiorseimicrobium undicola TaxID=1974746 RepID=A0A2H0LV90_9BACT|nr:MAG: acetate kinase [Candidatus Omnitrophica bacterium CG11_big_fil_rev_8_21_14_0_20_42_13]
MKILVINSGSSSIKYELFLMPQKAVLKKGHIDKIGEKGSLIRDHKQGLKLILEKLGYISCVGHRVVHGGEKFHSPTIINSKVIENIRALSALAPLHNPANLSGIIACKQVLKNVPQVAVFDTAFHQTLPEHAYIYGLPYDYYKKFKIRKYGFHGISHEYMLHEARRILNKPLNKINLISCHLGNGASISAIYKGSSVDTSMGFTPLEGLLMGTRCGDLDPALITYIMRLKKLRPGRIDEILNRESGLKGISGITNDMRYIKKAALKGNKRAQLALDIFVYRIRKYIGAYTAVLGNVDLLVFCGGIGENQRSVVSAISRGLFNNFKKKPKVCVIKTREELLIAEKAYDLVK